MADAAVADRGRAIRPSRTPAGSVCGPRRTAVLGPCHAVAPPWSPLATTVSMLIVLLRNPWGWP